METIVSHLDVTQIFCEVDDFCQRFEHLMQPQLQLPATIGEKQSQSRLHRCEIMTIVIAFHGSGFRSFKEFYTLQVLPHWRRAFPMLVSYNRFVELMPWGLMLLCCYLLSRLGDATGLEVCHPRRAHAHRTFQGEVGWGKSSVGWYYGFQLHLIVNEHGE